MSPQYTELVPGYEISQVIKGGWQLAGGHGEINQNQAIEDMFTYAEQGITTFDCADIYTGVEEMIGEFRRQYLSRYGAQKLSHIHVHTKFVPDITILPTITKQYVTDIIDRSLARLGVDQLDLVQYHWWDYDVPKYVETALYLQELQKAGKIRSLSVTNFDVPRLQEFVDQGIVITSTQNQYSVLDQRPEHGLVEFCQAHDIKILCYGTVAGGFLSERYLGQPEPEEPLENRSLVKYKLIIDDFGGWELFQELLRTLKTIADKYHVSLTNVAERYVLDKPQVAGIIVGARNALHLSDTLKVFNFTLDADDQAQIAKIVGQLPGPEGDTYSLERIKGGRHASIMKYNLNKEDKGV
jgi:aryl-alcohol dehydrogenase-like predicted oxidoreductase